MAFDGLETTLGVGAGLEVNRNVDSHLFEFINFIGWVDSLPTG
jgi:hypothetical protein